MSELGGRRRAARGRRGLRAVALVALLSAVALGTTACEPRPVDRTKPILFIHGWGGGGTDCRSTFGPTIDRLKAAGFTGPFVTVGFYDDDSNCSMTLRDWGPVENGSSYKVLAQAFSKYVLETYTKKGKAVDVVGYSMGGNIVRGAIYGASTKQSGFAAANIKVEDVVTFGSPFNGAAWYSSFCLWGQCSSLKPGAADITWLNENGNPQGVDGTEFTVFGSEADAVTPVDSALHMAVPANRKVRYTDVPHTGSDNYLGRATITARAAEALAKPES